MHRQARHLLGALALAAALGACGDATLDAGSGIREASPELGAGELMYLVDPEAVAAGFATGPARFEPSRTWTSAGLVLATEAPEALTWRAEFADGTATAWQPLPALEGEVPHVATVVSVDRPATALRLRGPDGLSFARLEFFAERRPEGAHPGHDDDFHYAEDHNDETGGPEGFDVDKRAHAGRWLPPGGGGRAYVPYTGAPAWNRGRNCSGRLTPGARELGEYLVRTFRGARSFQGYNCRQIAGTSSMSLHGTGRAIDVFIPLDRGQADNDLGDPVAQWLIDNAADIGIQLVIWDRTVWTGSRTAGSKARAYNGAHPHHDHLHIELTPDAGNRRTRFFGGNVAPPAGGGAAGQAACNSQTLGRSIPHGQCVQTAYQSCGGTCNWSRCADGSWQCADPGSCSVQHGNAQCAPPPAAPPQAPPPAAARAACTSRTLGRDVPHGQCVQMNYDSCGGTCRWAECSDGAWMCTQSCGQEHPHAACAAPPPAAARGAACWSRTLGRDVPHGEYVQMSYSACGGTCRYARCDDGGWICDAPGANDRRHPHARCR